jgi:hypothetical protein
LAQIAYESLQKQLELSLTGFQYKNTLIQAKAEAARTISNDYWTRYMQMLNYNQTKDYQDATLKLAQDEFEFTKQKYNDSLKTSGGSGGNAGASSGGSTSGKTGGVPIGKTPDKLEAPKAIGSKEKFKKKSTPKVDMKSVLKLGYGPISPKKLSTLVAEGKAKEVVKNGKLQFKKVFNGK